MYVSVRAKEYFDTVNYLASLDEKSLNFVNAAAYVRRRMGGMSLATQELLAPWDLPSRHVISFCITCVAYVKMLAGTLYKYANPENLEIATWWESLKVRIRDMFRQGIRSISSVLFSILFRFKLEDQLVLFPCCEEDQESYVRRKLDPIFGGLEKDDDPGHRAKLRKQVQAGFWMDFPNEEDLPDCDICLTVIGKMGDQRIKCEDKPESYHTFTLTDAQLARLKNDLRESDQDPPGLREVKKRALEHMPRSVFSHQVKVHYIKAGPGCGKSFLIRQLADENDLVLAPFSKLKTDYEKIKGTNGSQYDLPFKTQHRAMETRGFQRLFVDEFTSFPYEYLACIAYLNAAEEVYLVGDDKQTKIREPDEVHRSPSSFNAYGHPHTLGEL